MDAIFATAAAACGLFAGTNIDDMVVLAVLNASCRADGRPAAWQIWVGQYAGIAALVVISLLAALGLKLVPESWLWILGLIPLSLGLRKLVIALRAQRSGRRASPAVATGLTGVIGVTIANGGDNIAAYTPVFRTIGGIDIVLTIVVFIIGVALWCLAGFWLVSHHKITQVIERWGRWIVPAVFILIGLYIFHKSGALGF
jgi:cadmium resistance transport/sequestration family protein